MSRSNEVLLYNALASLTLHRNIIRLVALKHFLENYSVPAIYNQQHYCDACLLYGNLMNFPQFYSRQTTPAMSCQQYHPNYVIPPMNSTAAPVKNPQPKTNKADPVGNYVKYWNNNVAMVNNAGYWPPRKQSVLWSPDIDKDSLDFAAIHRESQQYNDCSLLYKKLDSFFVASVLERVAIHAAHSYHTFTESQVNILRSILHEGKSATVFDQLSWFGYDALITPEQHDTRKIVEYLTILKDFAGITAKSLEKTRNSMAIDFAINCKLSDVVIAACDEHFERGPRKRMAYTKMFSK